MDVKGRNDFTGSKEAIIDLAQFTVDDIKEAGGAEALALASTASVDSAVIDLGSSVVDLALASPLLH